jgi:hypothetical protein
MHKQLLHQIINKLIFYYVIYVLQNNDSQKEQILKKVIIQ